MIETVDETINRLSARVADFESGRVYAELQERINGLRLDVQAFGRIHDSAEAEVERLREENAMLTKEIEECPLVAEIERLRDELHDAEALIEDLRDGVKLNEEYRQEIERLRAEEA